MTTALPHGLSHEVPRRLDAHRPDRVLLSADTFAVDRARRALDVVLASVLLLLAAPLLGLAALLVVLTDGRPVVFRQLRVGEGGRPIGVPKLRTMSVRPGPAVTAADDARITRVGRLLRRTSIDELPQLWLVLRGQMTLVGPRPESLELAERYPASCRFILRARPGLTGPAQLAYRERSALPPEGWGVEEWYLERLVPLRAAADLDFLERPTLVRACGYLVRTALFVTGLRDYERTIAAGTPRTTTGSQRALTHSPVTRSNSKL